MSKLSNTLLLLSYLQNGKKYTIRELSENLEVSPRMIRIYKEDLEKAGFIIDTIYGPYGGYVLKKNNISILSAFNERDLALLNVLLSKEKDSTNYEYIETLIDRIKTMLASNSGETISDEIQNTYNVISRAIKEKRKIEITYYSFNKGLNTRTIHPLELFYIKDGFGVAAFCETKRDLRHFELKRIEKIKLLDKNF